MYYKSWYLAGGVTILVWVFITGGVHGGLTCFGRLLSVLVEWGVLFGWVSTSSIDEVLSGISLMWICPGSFLGTRNCLFQCTIWLSTWTTYDLSDSCSRHVPGYILAYFSLGKLLLCFLSFPAYAAFHTFHYCEMQETCGCGQQGPDSAWHQPLCWACSNAFCQRVSVVQQVLCSGIRTNQLLLCSGVCLECVDSAYKLLWVLCS